MATQRQHAAKNLQNAVRRILAPWVIGAKFFGPPERRRDSPEYKRTSLHLDDILNRDEFVFTADSTNLPALLEETANVLKIVTKAVGVTMYKVDPRENTIYMYTRQTTQSDRHKVTWDINSSKTVACFVAKTKDYVIINDVYTDARFPEGIDYEGNILIKSVLAVPVLTLNGDCYAVVELIRTVYDDTFTQKELKIVVMITGWMGAAIHQDWERETLQKHQEMNDYLLGVMQSYFSDTLNSARVMTELVKTAKSVLGAERGSLFLLDKERNELVAEFMDDGKSENEVNVKTAKARFKKDCGIAGVVAKTGMFLNVKDAYNDERFNKEIDEKTGFITRSILCSPILSAEDGVIGVVQVINKRLGGIFTIADEFLYNTFTSYFTIALHYKLVKKKTKDYQFVNKWYLLMHKYHGNPCVHDRYFLKQNYKNCLLPQGFKDFDWYIDSLDRNNMPMYCLAMFVELIGIDQIDIGNMMQFHLAVRKCYRDNIYHNYEHAFNVCHCIYLIVRMNYRTFTKLEIKALLVAALCHDIDHPGCTRFFLDVCHHDLVSLYQESPLQKRSYYVVNRMLTHFNIFPKLSPQEKLEFLNELKVNMLSIDLSLLYQYEDEINHLLTTDEFNWMDDEHRQYLKTVMLISAEMSDQFKNYSIAKNNAMRRFRETYHSYLNDKVFTKVCSLSEIYSERLNRIPKFQLKFITYYAIPCVHLLKLLLPNTEALYYNAVIISKDWGKVINDYGRKMWHPHDSIVRS